MKKSCQPAYFYFIDGKCSKCKSGCLNCSDTDPSVCLACSVGFYLFKSNCLEECPSEFYPTEQLCNPCDNSCEQCQGNGLSNCTKCESPLVLNEGICSISSNSFRIIF